MQKVDKEKTRYYLAKIHILFRGNFRTQEVPEARFAVMVKKEKKLCYNGPRYARAYPD